jgi:hypothetical protein
MALTEEQLNKQLADFFGKLTAHLDGQLAEFRADVNTRFDQVQTTVDGIAQHLDAFEQEQTIINHQVDGKLDQLAEATSIKWVTE